MSFWQDITGFFTTIFTFFGNLGNWLTTPLEYINIAPIYLIAGSGLFVVLGFHLIKLINPLS